jgi:predicted TIM-barrel fold metal-dependent hydrolase
MNQVIAQLLALPKIDAHCHVLDPVRFPYAQDVAYRPAGQEMGSAASFKTVMDFYGVQHALLVGPNSGYGVDNRCLLDAIAHGGSQSIPRFKGIAVVPNDCSEESLAKLSQQGIIGVAFNASLHGVAYYAGILPLLKRLAQQNMWAQFQVEGDQLIDLLPMIEASGVRLMIDHCGRPKLQAGVQQKGFQALLALGRARQALVKLSGLAKFSQSGFPFDDAKPFIEALARNFGLDRCMWASDWPYLKGSPRLDYGPMMALYAELFSLQDCEQLMWHTPRSQLHFTTL